MNELSRPIQLSITLTNDQLDELVQRVAEELRKKPAPTQDTYSVNEAAKILGVSGMTIRRYIAADILPRVPNLYSVRIPSNGIQRLLSRA